MNKENLFEENKIRTFSGIYIDPLNPKSEDILIEDIAHSLSMQCRFGGHLPVFYSVAQHSVRCCNMVTDEYKLQALMHDASEAYLMDIPRPIKHRIYNYTIIEENLMKCISNKFGFDWPKSLIVAQADDMAMQEEWDSLMIMNRNSTWPPINPVDAKRLFLDYFRIINND